MSTDLIPVSELEEKYPVLGDPDLMEAFTANLGDDDVSLFDLDRVKIPSGGATTWELPGLGDEPEATRELRGVVLEVISRRSYWEVSLDEQSEPSPPDCSSDTAKFGKGVYGVGSDLHPSGTCKDCPMNAFQEVGTRTIKPCSEQRLLIFLREGSVLPIVVQLPPTSMKEMKKYNMRLASNGIPFYRAVTTLKLTKVEKGNTPYAVVNPSLVGQVPAEQAKELRQMGETIAAAYNAQANAGIPVEVTGKESAKAAKSAAADA